MLSPGSANQTFDPDGNMLQNSFGSTFDEWDSAGRLQQITGVDAGDYYRGMAGIHQYGYDGSGRRSWKKVDVSLANGASSEHRLFLYAGPNCIAEYTVNGDSTTTLSREYVYGTAIDSLAMILQGGEKYSVTRNQQWSITALFGSDGEYVEGYRYDMFGHRALIDADGAEVKSGTRLAESTINPYGYASRRHDEESGLMYFRTKYYDTSTGEFVSKEAFDYTGIMSLYRACVPQDEEVKVTLVVTPLPVENGVNGTSGQPTVHDNCVYATAGVKFSIEVEPKKSAPLVKGLIVQRVKVKVDYDGASSKHFEHRYLESWRVQGEKVFQDNRLVHTRDVFTIAQAAEKTKGSASTTAEVGFALNLKWTEGPWAPAGPTAPVNPGPNIPIIPLDPFVPTKEQFDNWFRFAYPFGGLNRKLGVKWDCTCDPTIAATNPKVWKIQRKTYTFKRDGTFSLK